MFFTNDEMIGLNSIIDKNDIFGINLIPPSLNEQVDFVDKTINSLKVKGLIDDKGKLRKIGVIPIRLIEEYKNASQYIFINDFRIAFCEKDNFVILIQVENGYELLRLSKIVLLTQLLKKYSFLCLAQDKNIKPSVPYDVSYDLWEECLDNISLEEIIIISKYKNKEILDLGIIYGSDNSGYYDIINQKNHLLFARDLRIKLMELLEIESEKEKYA